MLFIVQMVNLRQQVAFLDDAVTFKTFSPAFLSVLTKEALIYSEPVKY